MHLYKCMVWKQFQGIFVIIREKENLKLVKSQRYLNDKSGVYRFLWYCCT